MLTKGDFHIHSTASDGELTPKEIILAAKEKGIDTLAIADHNTTNGIEEAVEAGMLHGVSIVPAVELSTRYNNESIHLLGYFRDSLYNDPTLKEVLKHVKNHKADKARHILSNFTTTDSSGRHLSVMEGLSLLKSFNAAVVLAHPVRISEKHIKEILNLPFDGIEAKYSRSDLKDTLYYVTMALTKFSFYTSGSDFHTNKRNDPKHSHIGEPYLNKAEIQLFLKYSGAILLS